MDWKKVHDFVLRRVFGGIAAVGIVTTFANFLCLLGDDSRVAQNQDAFLFAGSAAVTIAAAVTHAHLLKQVPPES